MLRMKIFLSLVRLLQVRISRLFNWSTQNKYEKLNTHTSATHGGIDLLNMWKSENDLASVISAIFHLNWVLLHVNRLQCGKGGKSIHLLPIRDVVFIDLNW
jgi:hypothetical protein